MAIAGIWEGQVTGEIMNADVKVTLHQERDMLYGALEILSGTFPTIDREFLVGGEVVNGTFLLEIRDFFDAPPTRDALPPFIGFRLFAEAEDVEGKIMSGDTVYFDETGRFDRGRIPIGTETRPLPSRRSRIGVPRAERAVAGRGGFLPAFFFTRLFLHA